MTRNRSSLKNGKTGAPKPSGESVERIVEAAGIELRRLIALARKEGPRQEFALNRVVELALMACDQIGLMYCDSKTAPIVKKIASRYDFFPASFSKSRIPIEGLDHWGDKMRRELIQSVELEFRPRRRIRIKNPSADMEKLRHEMRWFFTAVIRGVSEPKIPDEIRGHLLSSQNRLSATKWADKFTEWILNGSQIEKISPNSWIRKIAEYRMASRYRSSMRAASKAKSAEMSLKAAFKAVVREGFESALPSNDKEE